MGEPEHAVPSSRDAHDLKSVVVRSLRDVVVKRLLPIGHLARRPLTLGVRGAAFDAEGRVFLVRHTYVPGWYLPGGGVEAGETAAESLLREMREEGNLEVREPPRLVGVYLNAGQSRRDHVLLYRCDRVYQIAPRRPDGEIAASGFFDPDELPDGVTPATLRRLQELRQGLPPAPCW